MPGETHLPELLASMAPELRPGTFVFATLPSGEPRPTGVDPVMIFREREGDTLILLQDEARAAGLAFAFPSRMITLNVHSSLDAVGFLAAVTGRLAAAGIGVNPVAAFYHDHLFVPADRAEEATALLRALAIESRR